MANQKLYAGVKIRETRQKLALTQKDFAAKLGVSLSYLNQMENNHRPISAGVVLAMAQEFGFDVTQLSVAESDRMVVDMREALADPVFGDENPPLADLQLTASNAPMLARAFLNLHRSYRHSQDRLASLNEALGHDSGSIASLPWEEVRDFFHYCDNYIDSIDRAAEKFAKTNQLDQTDKRAALIAYLDRKHKISVNFSTGPLRQYDAERKVLTLSNRAGRETQIFQLAHQIALLDFGPLLEATLDFAKFRTAEARDICKIGLANYFAGATTLPYGSFLDAAREFRHDLGLLAERFDASIEQVAHRLSTLQRTGQKGIPFFFVRVDQAGTITKRHSATRLQFARFGGACPLWNVHRAFESPNQYLRQLAETPDGVRYFCLAKDISKPGNSFHSPTRRYAIGLGCEISHADQLVYTDDMDLKKDMAFEPFGVSCRICERQNCHQRAVPPLEHKLKVNHHLRDTLPYALD